MPYKDKRRQTENAIKWAKSNPERFHANQKRYRQRHPKGMADKSKRWRVANPEKMKEVNKRHRQTIGWRYKACKRTHERRGLIFDITQEEYDRMDLLKNCLICHMELDGRKVWEYDYRGFVHHGCNIMKGCMNISEFRKFISDIYHKFGERDSLFPPMHGVPSPIS